MNRLTFSGTYLVSLHKWFADSFLPDINASLFALPLRERYWPDDSKCDIDDLVPIELALWHDAVTINLCEALTLMLVEARFAMDAMDPVQMQYV